jgi:hypothetical protein
MAGLLLVATPGLGSAHEEEIMAFSRLAIAVGVVIPALTALLLAGCGGSSDGGTWGSSREGLGGEQVAVKWVEAAIAGDRQTAVTLWSMTGEDPYFGQAWQESVRSLAGCKSGNIKGGVLADVTSSNVQGVVGVATVTFDPPCGRDASSGAPLDQVKLHMTRPASYWFVQGYYP